MCSFSTKLQVFYFFVQGLGTKSFARRLIFRACFEGTKPLGYRVKNNLTLYYTKKDGGVGQIILGRKKKPGKKNPINFFRYHNHNSHKLHIVITLTARTVHADFLQRR